MLWRSLRQNWRSSTEAWLRSDHCRHPPGMRGQPSGGEPRPRGRRSGEGANRAVARPSAAERAAEADPARALERAARSHRTSAQHRRPWQRPHR